MIKIDELFIFHGESGEKNKEIGFFFIGSLEKDIYALIYVGIEKQT